MIDLTYSEEMHQRRLNRLQGMTVLIAMTILGVFLVLTTPPVEEIDKAEICMTKGC